MHRLHSKRKYTGIAEVAANPHSHTLANSPAQSGSTLAAFAPPGHGLPFDTLGK